MTTPCVRVPATAAGRHGLFALAGSFLVSLALAEPVAAQAGDGPGAVSLSGELRATWAGRTPASSGPLAQANARVAGLAPADPSAGTLQAELHAAARLGGAGPQAVRLATSVTLQTRRAEGAAPTSTGWVNEAVASGSAAGWQWSIGKKVVSWDVGYAFRPNDVVQQEVRRTLAPAALQGRPVLMAEHFTADTAWSLVAVNPGHSASADRGAREPALALRAYRHAGAVDWHGFARWGSHTRGSVGAAASWVATDALELHASLRHLAAFDTLASAATASGAAPGTVLMAANPWQASTGGPATQALVGGTWTNEHQLSLLAEWWFDGTALSGAQWRQWTARNQALPAWAALGAPVAAVAGNLAWQASALGASAQGSLHRQNTLVRLSWTHGAWQPALDVLWHPADGGRLLTASLVWQGDRVKLDGGLRLTGGPAHSVLRQLPVQRQAYVGASWAF